jgi:predicted O-methyltransferase YrrM
MLDLQQPYNQFSEHDEKTLARLAENICQGTFLEVGCWTGHSTSILAKRAKEIFSDIIVVDSFEGNEGTPLYDYAKENEVKNIFISNMKELDLWDNISLFHMDSNEAHKFIDNESVIFLFIDAGHTYEQVKEDLINYIPKVKKGGIICGHDYESTTYNEKYINEDYVDGKHHGVIKAVNEIIGRVEHEGRMWWVNV